MIRFTAPCTPFAIAALCGLVAPLPAQSAPVAQSHHPLHFSFVHDGDTVKVEVKDHDVAVTLNGKPMPKGRFQHHGDSYRFFDENGEQIGELQVAEGRIGVPSLSGTVAPGHGLGGHSVGGQGGAVAGSPPRLGITMSPLDTTAAEQLGLDGKQVFVIGSVVEGSAAEKAGLHIHDVVTRIDGEAGATQEGLRKTLARKKVGDTLEVHVVRHGEPKILEVKLDDSSGSVSGRAPSSGFGGAYEVKDLSNVLDEAKVQLERARKLTDEKLRDVREITAEAVRKAVEEVREKTQDMKLDTARVHELQQTVERATAGARRTMERTMDQYQQQLRAATEREQALLHAAESYGRSEGHGEGARAGQVYAAPRIAVRGDRMLVAPSLPQARAGGRGESADQAPGAAAAPTTPRALMAPRASVAEPRAPAAGPQQREGLGAIQSTLQRLEKRMDRLEELLRRLMDPERKQN